MGEGPHSLPVCRGVYRPKTNRQGPSGRLTFGYEIVRSAEPCGHAHIRVAGVIRSWLRKARRLRFINYPVRACIRAGCRLFPELRMRWPVSGTVEVTYESLKFKLHNRADDGFVQIFYYGLPYQESHVLAITGAFASKCSVILDIGANTGVDALIVAMRNPSTTIIAIEPYSPNYDRMAANLALNGISNVIPRKDRAGLPTRHNRFLCSRGWTDH